MATDDKLEQEDDLKRKPADGEHGHDDNDHPGDATLGPRTSGVRLVTPSSVRAQVAEEDTVQKRHNEERKRESEEEKRSIEDPSMAEIRH